MSGLLGTRASLAADLNLLLQIIILIILFVGFKFGKMKTEKSLKQHGRMMTIAVVLNAVAFLLVMGPSFISNFSAVLTEPFPLTLVHAIFGTIAEILGITFVFKKFGNVRMWMRLTFLFWLIALALGVAFYWSYYVR